MAAAGRSNSQPWSSAASQRRAMWASSWENNTQTQRARKQKSNKRVWKKSFKVTTSFKIYFMVSDVKILLRVSAKAHTQTDAV